MLSSPPCMRTAGFSLSPSRRLPCLSYRNGPWMRVGVAGYTRQGLDGDERSSRLLRIDGAVIIPIRCSGLSSSSASFFPADCASVFPCCVDMLKRTAAGSFSVRAHMTSHRAQYCVAARGPAEAARKANPSEIPPHDRFFSRRSSAGYRHSCCYRLAKDRSFVCTIPKAPTDCVSSEESQLSAFARARRCRHC